MTDRVQCARSEIEGSVDASLQHIALLRDREQHLARIREEAQAELLHHIGSAYNCGQIDDHKLSELFEAVKAARIPLSKWDQHVGVPWRKMPYLVLYRPNGPEGSWVGTWPLTPSAPRPTDGKPVVYVLYDASNEPCYVGSTAHFAIRLGAHAKDGKAFVRWQAHPCRDREDAYALEDRLLRERLPQLNRKASR